MRRFADAAPFLFTAATTGTAAAMGVRAGYVEAAVLLGCISALALSLFAVALYVGPRR